MRINKGNPLSVGREKFLIRKRSKDQRWLKGLWEFPMFNEVPKGKLTHVGSCRHTITHHRLEVQVYRGTLAHTKGFQWQAFDEVPMSSLTKKIMSVGGKF